MEQDKKQKILESLKNMLLVIQTDLPENEDDNNFDKELKEHLETTIAEPTDENILESLRLIEVYQETHLDNSLAQDLLALHKMEQADVLSQTLGDQVDNLPKDEAGADVNPEKQASDDTAQLQQVQDDLAKLQ